MHYMWRRQPYDRKGPRNGIAAPDSRSIQSAAATWVVVPAGTATLGADRGEIRFGWDNEFPRQEVDVPAFEIGVHDVTNDEFLEFVDSGGYRRRELWDDDGWSWVQSAQVSHPPFWIAGEKGWHRLARHVRAHRTAAGVAGVGHAGRSVRVRRLEGSAAADRGGVPPRRFRRSVGKRAGVSLGRRSAGRDAAATSTSATGSRSPSAPFPPGASAWGIHDLVGNGWEWTSTVFDGFAGFEPMASYPQYSADFFDGKHYVMKGASPVDRPRARPPQFRNWFRPDYPHVYATFRCVRDAADRMTLPTSIEAPPAESVRDFALDVRRDLALTPEADPVEVPLRRRSGRRSSRRSAGSRGTGSRAPRRACSRDSRPRSSQSLRAASDARRARLRQRREGRDARRGPPAGGRGGSRCT